MDPENTGELSDDEIEARQRAEDGEHPDHNPTPGEDEPKDGEDEDGKDKAKDPQDPEAKDPADKPDTDPKPNHADKPDPDKPAADTPAGGEGDGKGGKVDGVLSKDGARVLPYGALQAARRDARRAESRAERAERELQEARQQIENLKSGKATPAGEELTEEEVAAAERDFPEHGKKLRAAFDRIQELEKHRPKDEPAGDDDPAEDPVQEAIDQVPLLLEWQTSDAELFARAQEVDAVLAKSPKWKDKSAVERFTEVARMVADEHGIEFSQPEAKTSTKAADKPAEKPNPADKAVRKTPETLSDFKGGSVADHGTVDVKRATAKQLLPRMQGMSDEEIDAHLAKYG